MAGRLVTGTVLALLGLILYGWPACDRYSARSSRAHPLWLAGLWPVQCSLFSDSSFMAGRLVTGTVLALLGLILYGWPACDRYSARSSRTHPLWLAGLWPVQCSLFSDSSFMAGRLVTGTVLALLGLILYGWPACDRYSARSSRTHPLWLAGLWPVQCSLFSDSYPLWLAGLWPVQCSLFSDSSFMAGRLVIGTVLALLGPILYGCWPACDRYSARSSRTHPLWLAGLWPVQCSLFSDSSFMAGRLVTGTVLALLGLILYGWPACDRYSARSSRTHPLWLAGLWPVQCSLFSDPSFMAGRLVTGTVLALLGLILYGWPACDRYSARSSRTHPLWLAGLWPVQCSLFSDSSFMAGRLVTGTVLALLGLILYGWPACDRYSARSSRTHPLWLAGLWSVQCSLFSDSSFMAGRLVTGTVLALLGLILYGWPACDRYSARSSRTHPLWLAGLWPVQCSLFSDSSFMAGRLVTGTVLALLGLILYGWPACDRYSARSSRTHPLWLAGLWPVQCSLFSDSSFMAGRLVTGTVLALLGLILYGWPACDRYSARSSRTRPLWLAGLWPVQCSLFSDSSFMAGRLVTGTVLALLGLILYGWPACDRYSARSSRTHPLWLAGLWSVQCSLFSDSSFMAGRLVTGTVLALLGLILYGWPACDRYSARSSRTHPLWLAGLWPVQCSLFSDPSFMAGRLVTGTVLALLGPILYGWPACDRYSARSSRTHPLWLAGLWPVQCSLFSDSSFMAGRLVIGTVLALLGPILYGWPACDRYSARSSRTHPLWLAGLWPVQCSLFSDPSFMAGRLVTGTVLALLGLILYGWPACDRYSARSSRTHPLWLAGLWSVQCSLFSDSSFMAGRLVIGAVLALLGDELSSHILIPVTHTHTHTHTHPYPPPPHTHTPIPPPHTHTLDPPLLRCRHISVF